MAVMWLLVVLAVLSVCEGGALLQSPLYLDRLIPGVITELDGPVVDTQYGPVLGRTVPASDITGTLYNCIRCIHVQI